MRKILILFISLFFLTSSAYAISLNDSYYNDNSGIISFDISFIKDLLEANGEKTALTDYYNEMVSVIKERFGLDFDKDVEHIGFYILLKDNKIQPIGFISGNFRMEEIYKTIKEDIASEPELLDSIVINDKKKPTLLIDQTIFVGQNYNTIWFCDEYQFKHLEKEKIYFDNAPGYINELISKSNNFLVLKKELWTKFFGYDQKKLKIDLDNVNSISAYINNFDIFINANLDTKESAEVLKLQIDYLIKSYKDNQETLTIDDSFINIFKDINSLYLRARVLDILNTLMFEVNDNTLVIRLPYDRTNFLNAISDFITNIVIPSYQKIIEVDNISACYHTQHLLTKAVERYNNENEPMLAHYSDLYLSTNDCFPYEYSYMLRKGCRYDTVGQLDNGGYITCEKHGPAVPLIKPQFSKERIEREEEMLICFDNMREIREAVQSFNSQILYHTYNKNSKIDPDTPLITTDLDIDLLKEKGVLREYYVDLPKCEYYIKGDLGKKGYIGCKKHGLLTNGQLYSAEYDFHYRRPNKNKYDVVTQIIKNNPIKPKTKTKEINQKNQTNTNNDEASILRKCNNNIRVLTGAIEMYNMDSPVMMKDNLDYNILIKGKYLLKEPDKPSPECEYYIDGDITDTGCISCKKHGSI